MRINEVIVVEGKNDTRRLQQYFECETIETNGLSLDEKTIDFIREVSGKRGVIVFTDPDSPGNRIRQRLNEAIPGLKNAFVIKKDARTDKKVGIEHASKEVLEQALESLITFDEKRSDVTMRDLYDLGLCGREDSFVLREYVAEKLHTGMCNSRTFLKRLQMLGTDREKLEEVLNDR